MYIHTVRFYQLSVIEFYVKCYVHWKLIQSRWWTGDTPFVLLKGRTPDFHLSLNWIRCGLSQCAVKSWIPTSFVTSSPSVWNGGEFPTLVMKLTDVVWSFCWTLHEVASISPLDQFSACKGHLVIWTKFGSR